MIDSNVFHRRVSAENISARVMMIMMMLNPTEFSRPLAYVGILTSWQGDQKFELKVAQRL